MAIIGGRGEATDTPSGATLIARGTRLVGDLAVTGKLHIDGDVEGRITTAGEVSIGERGQVSGTIRAHRVLVAGCFQGGLFSSRLEIVASGRVEGEVETDQLIIEAGGRLQGSSRMGMAARPERDPLEADEVQATD